jgi:hypothetical protein
MSAPSSPPWLLAATRRRISYVDLRISDAERAEVADLLAKHYGDGRLDEAEFNQRLDQAMRARTYKDLGGLFADLPRTDAEGTRSRPADSMAAGATACSSWRLSSRSPPPPDMPWCGR